MRLVFFNGEFVPENEAKISIYDSALMFGDMVFEMTRSFNNNHWMLEEHIERLLMGCKILRIDLPYTKNELIKICEETANKNKSAFEYDDEHRLLIDVSRGLLSIYDGIDGLHKGTNTIVADFPLRWTIQGSSHLYDSGINLINTNQKIIPSRYLDPKIKNRSRLHYMMANLEVSNISGKDNWALLQDENGNIAEGTGSNFFMVKDDVIYTPPLKDSLRGITQDAIIKKIAPRIKKEVKILEIEPYDIYQADEAFLTSTPFCILPATSLNKIKIGDGLPGKVTKDLLDSWSELVEVDIVNQIKSWDLGSKSGDMVTPYQFKK